MNLSVKASSGTRLRIIASLLLGAFSFTNSPPVSAQTVTSNNGPVCSIEYVPYGPSSNYTDYIKVTTSTANHCYAPQVTHLFCSTMELLPSRCNSIHTLFKPASLNALSVQVR